jgi:hypothetical protein
MTNVVSELQNKYRNINSYLIYENSRNKICTSKFLQNIFSSKKFSIQEKKMFSKHQITGENLMTKCFH